MNPHASSAPRNAAERMLTGKTRGAGIRLQEKLPSDCMETVPDHWHALTQEDMQRRFGKTTWKEAPKGWGYRDLRHFVVLQDMPDGDEIWWSLFRAESGEYVELARNYGDEIWDSEDDGLEIHWDGEFPVEWVQDFVSGEVDWIRLSTSELLENFGPTVETEQPQAWRHREGEHFLVLVGEGLEGGEEEFSWSVVREGREGYEEIGEFFPSGAEGGADDDEEEVEHSDDPMPEGFDAPAVEELPPAGEAPPPVDPEDKEPWWEIPPFEWAAEVVSADIEARES